MSTYKPSERTHKPMNLPFLLVTEHSTAYCTKLNPCSLPLPFFRLGPEPMGRQTHKPYTKVHIHTQTHTHRHTCTNVYERTQACRDTGPQQSASAWTPTHKHTFKWHGNTFGQAQMTLTTSQPHTSQHWKNSWSLTAGCCWLWILQQMELQQQQGRWGEKQSNRLCQCACVCMCNFCVSLHKSFTPAILRWLF